jgi:hypothetical protein
LLISGPPAVWFMIVAPDMMANRLVNFVIPIVDVFVVTNTRQGNSLRLVSACRCENGNQPISGRRWSQSSLVVSFLGFEHLQSIGQTLPVVQVNLDESVVRGEIEGTAKPGLRFRGAPVRAAYPKTGSMKHRTPAARRAWLRLLHRDYWVLRELRRAEIKPLSEPNQRTCVKNRETASLNLTGDRRGTDKDDGWLVHVRPFKVRSIPRELQTAAGSRDCTKRSGRRAPTTSSQFRDRTALSQEAEGRGVRGEGRGGASSPGLKSGSKTTKSFRDWI